MFSGPVIHYNSFYRVVQSLFPEWSFLLTIIWAIDFKNYKYLRYIWELYYSPYVLFDFYIPVLFFSLQMIVVL